MIIHVTPMPNSPDAAAFATALLTAYKAWAKRHNCTVTDLPNGIEVKGDAPFYREPGSHRWCGTSAHYGSRRAATHVNVMVDNTYFGGYVRDYTFAPGQRVKDCGNGAEAHPDTVMAGDFSAFYQH